MIAARSRTITAIATKVPATFPLLAKNPSFGFAANAVSAGGAVGVIVNVLTWPGAVRTEMIGVGVHVELELELLSLGLVDVLTTGASAAAEVEVARVEGEVEDSVVGVYNEPLSVRISKHSIVSVEATPIRDSVQARGGDIAYNLDQRDLHRLRSRDCFLNGHTTWCRWRVLLRRVNAWSEGGPR